MWPQVAVDNAHKSVSVSERGGTVRIVFGRLSDQYGPSSLPAVCVEIPAGQARSLQSALKSVLDGHREPCCCGVEGCTG